MRFEKGAAEKFSFYSILYSFFFQPILRKEKLEGEKFHGGCAVLG